MTRLRKAVAAVDLTDLALVAGVVLLWVGLGMVAQPLPYIVIGVLLVTFGAAPIVATMLRRGR